ncbi:MAG: hypothetical protein K2L97_07865 [Muribaculaceae bacterium]|nr:hypothetical protein [Muribaculaceae bacterium]
METNHRTHRQPTDESVRSPKIRELLSRKPMLLYLTGYGVLIFCCIVLTGVAWLLGWI